MVFVTGVLLAADGKSLYSKCASCHGVNGERVYAGKVPALAGQEESHLRETLKGYLNGTRNEYGMGVVMSAQSRLHLKTDEQIDAVSRYLSGKK